MGASGPVRRDREVSKPPAVQRTAQKLDPAQRKVRRRTQLRMSVVSAEGEKPWSKRWSQVYEIKANSSVSLQKFLETKMLYLLMVSSAALLICFFPSILILRLVTQRLLWGDKWAGKPQAGFFNLATWLLIFYSDLLTHQLLHHLMECWNKKRFCYKITNISWNWYLEGIKGKGNESWPMKFFKGALKIQTHIFRLMMRIGWTS